MEGRQRFCAPFRLRGDNGKEVSKCLTAKTRLMIIVSVILVPRRLSFISLLGGDTQKYANTGGHVRRGEENERKEEGKKKEKEGKKRGEGGAKQDTQTSRKPEFFVQIPRKKQFFTHAKLCSEGTQNLGPSWGGGACRRME